MPRSCLKTDAAAAMHAMRLRTATCGPLVGVLRTTPSFQFVCHGCCVQVLATSDDLKTSACCTAVAPPPLVRFGLLGAQLVQAMGRCLAAA